MCVHWRRRKLDPLRVTSFRPGLSVEPFAARVFVDMAFVDRCLEGGTDAIEADLASERSVLPEGARMLYVLQGAKAAATKWGQRSEAEQRALLAGKRRKEARVMISADALDYALLHLYVSAELEVKETVR